MSHEISGYVQAVGHGVTGIDGGDLATIDPQIHCRQCATCRAGLISICPDKRVLGSSLRGFEQGGMQEALHVPVPISCPTGTVRQRTDPTKPQTDLYACLDLPLPKKIIEITAAGR